MKPMTAIGRNAAHLGGVMTALILGASLGSAGGQDESLCDQAAQKAAATSGVPVEFLLAITRVETGRRTGGQLHPWPWTINLAGQGYWFGDASEAMEFATDQLALGQENFDVGCFQINLHWHGAEFASLKAVFDPQTNADYAADFLATLYDSEGGWPEAVAAYHSRTPDKAADYLQKVEAVLAGFARGDTPEMAVVKQPRVNRYPLLQAGAVVSGASLVPLLQGATPLIGVR